MSLFGWLFIGHLIGDWLLQNDWMAKNKQRNLFTIAGFTHFIIYTLCMMLMLWSIYPNTLRLMELLLFGFFTFVSHWLIDALALAGRWGCIVQQSDDDFVRIMVDQSFHLIIIALLVRFLLEIEMPIM
ncbi:DUF3307 domain-containing protein [Chloroflexi bacterium TSY]|nr:DUF3307 domain-containing protein [Chloroflexi bacterium TSY]